MKQAALFSPVLVTGRIIIMLSFALRTTFWVFQIPWCMTGSKVV